MNKSTHFIFTCCFILFFFRKTEKGQLIETIGMHQDWDFMGRNKKVVQNGVFYFHVGGGEQSDMMLAGETQTKLNNMRCISSNRHISNSDQISTRVM